MRQAKITGLAFFGVAYMPFKLVSKVAYGGGNGPGGGVAQGANGIAFYLALYVP
jgi:hypothetical protein